MSTALTTAVLCDAIKRIVAKLEMCADELNALDAVLGDGDLGVTMLRGGRSVLAELPNLPDDIGMALFKCAQAFTRLSGSTYGTLLATGLMSAAKTTKGRREVSWSEISSLLANAIECDVSTKRRKTRRQDCARRSGVRPCCHRRTSGSGDSCRRRGPGRCCRP